MMETCLFFNDCDTTSLGNHILDDWKEKTVFCSFDSSSVEQEAESLQFSLSREKGAQDDDFFNLNFMDTFSDPDVLSRNLPNILEDTLPTDKHSLSDSQPNLEEPCPSLPETLATLTSITESQAPPCTEVPQLVQMQELIGNLDESLKISLRNSLYQLSLCVRPGEAKFHLDKAVESNLMKMLFGCSSAPVLQQVQNSRFSWTSGQIPQVPLPLDFSKLRNMSASSVPSPLEVALPSSPLSFSADSSPRAILCLSPSLVRPLSSPDTSPVKQTSQKRSLSMTEGEFMKTKRTRTGPKTPRKLKTSASLSIPQEARATYDQLLKGNSATAQ
eukprot:TRINITY_DN6290_c0_g1_i1.p1 TRINITY_DN6290_c0_g1~~TRINITY_DN6290_c0_g1_i1.p1  ORF type:complete len:330 (+),score=53.79 TRINITY_DN6290_c0_g1_i1:81-1070(+)